MSAAKIPGFDYVTGKAVAYTAAEWRAKYPASLYDRATKSRNETGHPEAETWYRANRSWKQPRDSAGFRALVAEAYAIIPAGKVSA